MPRPTFALLPALSARFGSQPLFASVQRLLPSRTALKVIRCVLAVEGGAVDSDVPYVPEPAGPLSSVRYASSPSGGD